MAGSAALIVASYLLGSLPHLQALGKLRRLNLEGDLHINLWRKGGRFLGAIGIAGDFIKGIIPVLVGKYLDFDPLVIILAGLAAVSGQMWPVFSRFSGEKGNSIGIGMAAALTPKPMLITLLPIATAAAIRTVPRLLNSSQSLNERLKFDGLPSRSLPLGMAIGFLLLPFASWWLGEPVVITLGYFVLFGLIIVRRATAGLRSDLRENTNIRDVLINRILYDRAKI